MDKNEVLDHLRAAKAAHIAWVQRAKLLVAGLPIKEDAIPVNSTECKFGKWFYSDAQKLNAFQNNPLECMMTIESLHFQLHDVYLKIYKIYYQTESKGFFSKLFGLKRKVTEEENKIAKEYFDKMEQISKKLIEEINRMERRIVAIGHEEFATID